MESWQKSLTSSLLTKKLKTLHWLKTLEDEVIYVEPPVEHYPKDRVNVVWRFRKALYGLKTAPEQWKGHLRSMIYELPMKGEIMKSEPNIYYFRKSKHYMLVYVDDVVIVGYQPQPLFDEQSKKIALKKSDSRSEGQTVKFLGR